MCPVLYQALGHTSEQDSVSDLKSFQSGGERKAEEERQGHLYWAPVLWKPRGGAPFSPGGTDMETEDSPCGKKPEEKEGMASK